MTVGDALFQSICVLCGTFLLWRFGKWWAEHQWF